MTRTKSIYLTLLAVLLSPMAANADLFTYSYLFDDGTTVSGTLEGTAAGDYVVDVSNVILEIDGIDVGPTDLFSFWVFVGTDGEPYDISFDATLNNFWFVAPDAVDADGNILDDGSYGFALIGSAVVSGIGPSDLAYVHNLPGIGNYLERGLNDSWELRAVPEPGTLALLGLGLLGMGAARRRKKA